MAEQSTKGMYVANRDFTVSSLTGHTLRFKKDEPRFVPAAVRRECLRHGIIPVEGEEMPIKDEGKKDPNPPPIGEDRDIAIQEAIELLIERDDRGDFTGAGIPKVEAIEKICEFNIDAGERDRIYREMKQDVS